VITTGQGDITLNSDVPRPTSLRPVEVTSTRLALPVRMMTEFRDLFPGMTLARTRRSAGTDGCRPVGTPAKWHRPTVQFSRYSRACVIASLHRQ